MTLIKCVKQSLFPRWNRNRFLLLGFSGGPDSTALLHALLELDIRPILAHVDHGWREESQREALLLQEMAAQLKLEFFSTRLKLGKTNLEEASREGRFTFFQTIYQARDCQALLLAHHGDDQIETSLQRLFEGAHLPFLDGIRPVQRLWGMDVWRPLLKVSKAAILEFLEERKISYFQDPTNADSRFLRGRIRSAIPIMEQTFRKSFRGNLTQFAERAEELRHYLEKRTEEAHQKREIGSNSISWDVTGLEKIEARFLLQRSVKSIPKTILEPLLDAALEGGKGRRFLAKGMEWQVYGSRIFLLQKEL